MFSEITRFVNWMRRRNPGADTAKSYRYHLRKFTQIVGDRSPGEVTLHDIDTFIEFQAERGLKSCSINRSLTAITSFYRFLADEDPTLECPVLRHRHWLRDHQRLPRAVPRSGSRNCSPSSLMCGIAPSSCSCCAAVCAYRRWPDSSCATCFWRSGRPVCACTARTARNGRSTSRPRQPQR